MRPTRLSATIVVMLVCGASHAAPEAAGVRAPLPIESVLDTKIMEERAAVSFSPDGRWATVVYQTARDTHVAGGNALYSATGVPLTEGRDVRRARITRLADGLTVELSSGDTSSWSPSWSPDGARLAYYSDEGGEAGLWVWSVAAQTSQRIGAFVVRPGFAATDVPRWLDRTRLVTKILPDGMSLAEANKLIPRSAEERELPPPPTSGKASLLVWVAPTGATAGRADRAASVERGVWVDAYLGDVAVIDVAAETARRIATRTPVRGFKPSPDGRRVAYAELKGMLADTQVVVYDLRLYDLDSGLDRVLVPNARLSYGHEFSWSPDGRSLALSMQNEARERQLYVARLGGELISFDGAIKEKDPKATAYDSGGLIEEAPLWSTSGAAAFSIVSGQLWRFDPETRQAGPLVARTGLRMSKIASREGSGRIFDAGGGAVLVFARDEATSESQILRIDPDRKAVEVIYRAGRRHMLVESSDVSPAGELLFAMSDAAHIADQWMFDPRTRRVRQLSQLNPWTDRYRIGETRLVKWTSTRGDPLEGILMLPPGFMRGDTPPPLLAFVYGGDNDNARALNRYGMGWGELPTFNWHILTTRGYAVFFPNMPVRPGEPIESFMETLDPGIDMLVKAGLADAQRLAISGQSYGSYTTWSVIGRTTRFKAAITTANALHPDLIADFLRLAPDGSLQATGYWETGQGNMLGDPWSQRERYLRNSPVAALDRIQTPLLMGQGSLDGLLASDAMFAGLKRLGKTVEYRIYPGEEHVLAYRGNVRDFWIRRLEFLEQHLAPSANATRSSP